MFLIIANHYSVYGGWDYPLGVEFHKFYTQALSVGGKVGVNFFVLIPGYVLYSRPFTWDGVINILAKTWFYSLAILLFFFVTDDTKITSDALVVSLFPFGYSFVTAFVCMLVLSPFINIMINHLSKKEHLRLIAVFTVLLLVPLLNDAVGCMGLFIYLYCVGAFLGKYYEDKEMNSRLLILITVFCFVGILFSIIVFDYLSLFTNVFDDPLCLIKTKTPFVLCLSVVLFIYFKQMKVGCVKAMEIISPAMLGVYLIHENILVRPFLWHHVLENNAYLNTEYIYIHSFASIIAVFIMCVAIDLTVSKVAVFLRLPLVQERLSAQVDKGLRSLNLI